MIPSVTKHPAISPTLDLANGLGFISAIVRARKAGGEEGAAFEPIEVVAKDGDACCGPDCC